MSIYPLAGHRILAVHPHQATNATLDPHNLGHKVDLIRTNYPVRMPARAIYTHIYTLHVPSSCRWHSVCLTTVVLIRFTLRRVRHHRSRHFSRLEAFFTFRLSAMGLFKRKAPNQQVVAIAQEEAPQFERVSWTTNPGLRKLYWHVFVLSIASATTGYDGMFFNSVQNFDSWKSVSYDDNPLHSRTIPV